MFLFVTFVRYLIETRWYVSLTDRDPLVRRLRGLGHSSRSLVKVGIERLYTLTSVIPRPPRPTGNSGGYTNIFREAPTERGTQTIFKY